MGSPKEPHSKPRLPKLKYLKSTIKNFFTRHRNENDSSKKCLFDSKEVKCDPAKCDPVKSDTAKNYPVKSDQAKCDPAKSDPVKISCPSDETLSADMLHLADGIEAIKLDLSKLHSPAVRNDSSNQLEKASSTFESKTEIDSDFVYTSVKPKTTSQSSSDSGYCETAFTALKISPSGDGCDIVAASLKDGGELSADGKKCDGQKAEKKRHVKTVCVGRGLTPHKQKHRAGSRVAAEPYGGGPHEITQINEKTLSGGQLTVVSKPAHEFAALEVPPTEQIDESQLSLEIAAGDEIPVIPEECMKILEDVISPEAFEDCIRGCAGVKKTFDINAFRDTDFLYPSDYHLSLPINQMEHFMTPPRSNESPTLYSPISQNYGSPNTPPYYAESSCAHTSPCSSPHLISNTELTYMFTTLSDLTNDTPQIVLQESTEEEKRVRVQRRSSVNMSMITKQLAQMGAEFAAKDCCRKERMHPKVEMSDYLEMCGWELRKAMSLSIAALDFDKLFKVLFYNVLHALELPPAETDARNLVLFNLICLRLLAEKPEVFLRQDYGLALLVRASVRCPSRPLLTRYLVWCVRCALRARPPAPGPVFTQTDSAGETLAGALARRGDACADCLAEIVGNDGHDTPLFDLQHRNTEGYTALHVACQLHSASLPMLHTVHILLAHGGVPRTITDNKASNTPLHCAADSRGCELPLVLAMFHDVPRSDWRQLAHLKNASQRTPLDLARAAFKSTSPPDYLKDVFDFLQRAAKA